MGRRVSSNLTGIVKLLSSFSYLVFPSRRVQQGIVLFIWFYLSCACAVSSMVGPASVIQLIQEFVKPDSYFFCARIVLPGLIVYLLRVCIL